ncbi:TonB-dependent siderophore receptor [Novosphingobium sp. Chol11]|uniref:TonB-dependent siderophore receptor n=1 Tax=Novosphingobium sp. Chol11 TaxID=1385763 RepID=UPI001596B8A3
MTNHTILKLSVALSALALTCPAMAEDAAPAAGEASASEQGIIVTARAGTKTETPPLEVPQPVTVISERTYLSQGAISISDTVKYAAGVTANAYGRDTRVDNFVIRGIDALQFRDGMRDIFSYYASITSDPYNFSQVEIVRGPASVLFGQGSIGGLVNLVSKTPTFQTGGEASIVYGSYDRKEAMGDVNVALSDTLAVRAVGRVRDADTYVDHVRDDRVMFAPSVRWQPTPDTDLVLQGLYQKDKSGSTSQFLPVVGTFRPNPNNGERLDPFLFVGKPGWDRYDGRTLQGGGSLTQRFGDNVQLNVKARYIDSDVTYFTHYADSYTNPTNPYLDPAGRTMTLLSDGSYARMNVFSTDNNLLFNFNTGADIEHKLLVGLDYSWNKVSKRAGGGSDIIDIYDIDYDALTIPAISPDWAAVSQKQLGIYVQDQIRFWDRVSVVLGARRDRVTTSGTAVKDKATTFRAGIIGELGAGFSPFFSYTESFLPIAMTVDGGSPARPQRGTQYEVGFKWQPERNTLITVTGFHIKEINRIIYGSAGSITQSGEITSKGIEIEASHQLPGNFELLANYGYNKLVSHDTATFDYLPRHTASLWTTKTFGLEDGAQLRLGAGVNYTGKRTSIGSAWTLVTPSYTLVDALAEISWKDWRFAVNATNLLNKQYFASCLARGDCFVGAPRNVMGTVSYRF